MQRPTDLGFSLGRTVWCGLALALLGACSNLPHAQRTAEEPPVQACRSWFNQLDQQIDQHGVRDAQDHRVPGFAQLRVSRFAASFRAQVDGDEAAFPDWMNLLHGLGTEAHAVEIANLPAPAIAAMLAGSTVANGRSDVAQEARRCADILSAADRRSPERRALLIRQSAVPDAYSTAARVAGLYAFSRLPFALGVRRWQHETARDFQREASADGPSVRYVPQTAEADPDAVTRLAHAPRDALGIPRLDEQLREQLLDRFAPVWAVAQGGAFDRLGTLELQPDGLAQVDTAQPAVYRRLAFARQAGATIVQLVYLAWFPERPRTGVFDLLGGHLDGVVWRVTLDPRGKPLLYDSIHACGCYHLFFPAPALRVRPAPEPGTEWVFTPAATPPLGAGERMVLRLASGSHYLTGLSTTRDPGGQPYRPRSEAELRSLVLGSDPTARRSLYGPDGIVPGTQRRERYLFWPMGVRDAGAQRQWGQHATAFIGRRHFDDPDLIDLRFEAIGAPREEGDQSLEGHSRPE